PTPTRSAREGVIPPSLSLRVGMGFERETGHTESPGSVALRRVGTPHRSPWHTEGSVGGAHPTKARNPGDSASHAAPARPPDGLVELGLEPDRQPGFEDPGGQLVERDLPVGGPDQDRDAFVEAVATDHLDAPEVVVAVADDELDLVAGLQ